MKKKNPLLLICIIFLVMSFSTCEYFDKKEINSKPKIQLPVKETNKRVCPYCGAIYGGEN